MGLATEEFNRFTTGLDYPMFVVTTTDGTERSGCLIGFASQVSIHPPRMLACLSVRNHTHGVAERAELLGMHVVEERHRDLVELFGGETGDEVDKFAHCDWQPGPGGVPLLEDCPQRMVGRILQRISFGDHTGHLLEPIAAERRDGDGADAVTFQQARHVEPGHEA